MKVLVTGANGFVGKNLVQTLRLLPELEVFEYTRASSLEDLEDYTKEADFVFHIAGVNRPENETEFMEGNFGLTSLLLDNLVKHSNRAPVLMTSSIQAELDNPYGKSKLAGEDLIQTYSVEQNVQTYIYRLPNLFGKWSKPNYNSVVATFCHNVANDIEITVNNPEAELKLTYIDDVITELINAMTGKAYLVEGFGAVPVIYDVKLGQLADLIQSFKDSRQSLVVPDMANPFVKKLYSTYLSYLPTDGFSYPLIMHQDERGSFTEFVKSPNGGQVSINISRPGITKGNHWHHTKNEKFLVVKGKGIIRFRSLFSDEVIEYPVTGDKLEVVDIPVGYTHSIVNNGKEDMVTVMWVNESFDQNKPDTYFLEV